MCSRGIPWFAHRTDPPADTPASPASSGCTTALPPAHRRPLNLCAAAAPLRRHSQLFIAPVSPRCAALLQQRLQQRLQQFLQQLRRCNLSTARAAVRPSGGSRASLSGTRWSFRCSSPPMRGSASSKERNQRTQRCGHVNPSTLRSCGLSLRAVSTVGHGMQRNALRRWATTSPGRVRLFE